MIQAAIVLALAFGGLSVLRLLASERAFIARRFGPILATAFGLLLALRGGIAGAVIGPLIAGAAWAVSLYGGGFGNAAAGPGPEMSVAEACALLGVEATATPDQIKAAFRAKMRAAHPDQGGSGADAAKLIAARALLLRRSRT